MGVVVGAQLENTSRPDEGLHYLHCLRQAPVEDRTYVYNNNVVPLQLLRHHAIARLVTVQATKDKIGYICWCYRLLGSGTELLFLPVF